MGDLDAAVLARLRAELAPELAVIADLGADIARLAPSTAEAEGDIAVLALRVHRWYTAIESTIARIERVFGVEPRGGDWHAELLRGATLDIAAVRPPIVAPGLLADLRDVMRFRHFFRHAYAVELDHARLLAVAARCASVRQRLDDGFASFDTFLAALIERLNGPPG